MTDCREKILAAVGYAEIYPSRCCKNCAYCIDNGRQWCVRLKAVSNIVSDSYATDCSVSGSGICDKWLSPAMVALAAECSCIEELEMRKQVLFGDEELKAMDLTELNDWFSDRKATPKMLKLRDSIVRSMTPKSYETGCKGISEPPIAPVREDTYVETGKVLRCGLTDAFWPVHTWIKQNKPVWDDWMEKRKTEPSLGTFSLADPDPREKSILSQVLVSLQSESNENIIFRDYNAPRGRTLPSLPPSPESISPSSKIYNI